ncbi:MAG: hypothetical protein R2747_03070 [Pyrinomonadaceae bacterium]
MEKKKIPDIKRQGWSSEKITRESANKDPGETIRQILRGDETKGDPEKRDFAGSPPTELTPQEKEEKKK